MVFASCLYDLTKFCFKKVIENRKWYAIFEESRNNIIKSLEADNSDYIHAVKELFSVDKIEFLAASLSDCNGFEFKKELSSAVDEAFDFASGVDRNIIDFLKKNFLADIINNLRINYPDLYRDIIFNEFMLATKNSLASIVTCLEHEELAVYNIWQIDKYLKNKNDYDIGLNFFDFNEEDTDKRIIDSIINNRITYIQGLDREEALYYVLRVLMNQEDLCDDVVLVNDLDTWNRLIDKMQGKIMVPLFSAVQIDPLPNCKNVYIVSKDIPLINKTSIKIINRTKSNLYYKLKEYINDDTKVKCYLNDNACLFSILKKKIFHGNFSQPQWWNEMNSDKIRILLSVLLLGAWSDSKQKRDCEIIASLFGENIKVFNQAIKPLMEGNEPFIIRIPQYSYTEYRVADLSSSWGCLARYLDEDVILIFKDLANKVLLDINSQLEYGIMKVDCGYYSDALKQGILKTLIYLNLFSKTDDNVNYGSLNCSSKIVKDILTSDYEAEAWNNIAEMMPELVEAAPSVFVDAIKYQISKLQSGIWAIFENRGQEPFTYAQYPKLLHALEKALFIEETRSKSILILEKLITLKLNNKIVNSPLHTLANVFCGFIDELGLGLEARKELLNSFAERDMDSCWKLIQNILPTHMGGIYDYLSKPEYIPFDNSRNQLEASETIKAYKDYFEIAFKCAADDLDKWIYFFKSGVFLAYNFQEIVFEKVRGLLEETNISDRHKYDISQVLREFIYNNRYYKNRRYIKNEVLDEVESIYDGIAYKNDLYKYLFMFEEKYMPLHQVAHEKVDYSEYINQINLEQEKLQIGVWERLDIKDKLSFLVLIGDARIAGISLAKSLNNELNKEIINELYNQNKKSLLTSYIATICNQFDIQQIRKLLNTFFSDFCLDIRYMVLDSQVICAEFLDLLDGLNEEEQRYFWSKTIPCISDKTFKVIQRTFRNLINYGNFYAALLIVKFNNLQLDDYMLFLQEYCKHVISGGGYKCDSYDIRYVFKEIYKYKDVADDYKNDILSFEEFFLAAFDGSETKLKPIYLYNKLYDEPEFCASIIRLTYKTDNGESIEYGENEQFLGKCLGRVFEILRFSPGVDIYGNYAPEVLKPWLSRFIECLILNKQIRIGYHVLGKLFAFFPKGLYDTWLPKEMCQVIDKWDNESLKSEFRCQCYNDRGAYIANNGKETIPYYEEYKKYSKATENCFPVTSTLFMSVAKDFKSEIDARRVRAIHEYF